jgi:deoxynucleoside triphosphate triphosphohydrolase SAMHD1
MFKRVYTHRVAGAIENMIIDALVLADPVLHISDMVDSPAQFLSLSDSLLRDIGRSTDPQLAEARAKVDAIQRRQLYRFVDEVYMKQGVRSSGRFGRDSVSPERIVAHHSSEYGELVADDIIVDWVAIHFGLKNGENPLEKTRFFRRWEAQEARHLPLHTISGLLPHEYREDIVRVYCRNGARVRAALHAFRKFVRSLPEGLVSLTDRYGMCVCVCVCVCVCALIILSTGKRRMWHRRPMEAIHRSRAT